MRKFRNLILMTLAMAAVAVTTGCEPEKADEFACSRQFSVRSKIAACKIGIQLAHEIGNQDDANERCANRYDLTPIDPDGEDAFEQLVAESGLFEACTRGVKGFLDYQEPAERERLLREADSPTDPGAGLPCSSPNSCVRL